MTTFGARLECVMQERGPLCVGIDPHAALLQHWALEDTISGLESFALTAAEALAPVAAAIKPQSAFFERHGSRGIAVLERVISICNEAGSQVILDVKRGDIGSTSQAYADAYLDPASPLSVDAITASPYLGFGSLQPMIETAQTHEKGVFVLALTSNPEAPQVQHARNGERTVAGEMLDALRKLNNGQDSLGSFGAVVGATIKDNSEDLAINGPLLVPGIGAQGGTIADVRRIFAGVLHQVLPSSSREVLGQGPDPVQLAAAARRTAADFATLVGRG
jgi:orotidine-5'-phosphate decarboxylase